MIGAKDNIPLSEVKNLPYKTLNRMIDKMRVFLKKDPVVQNMFKEYDVDIDEIDLIPMRFDDLEVSAQTNHAVIIFSYKLLTDGDFFKDFSYGIHEMNHYLQQTTSDKPTQSSNDGKYLDNKYEQEAFQNQISYISEHFGDEEAEDYMDHLLDHHDINDDNEKDKLENILMEKI